jgi:hypothetical protein
LEVGATAGLETCATVGYPKLRAVNTIGLRFLARHRLTLNIPKGVLYLKRERVGPLD